jgi:NAD-dependent DNA ligase
MAFPVAGERQTSKGVEGLARVLRGGGGTRPAKLAYDIDGVVYKVEPFRADQEKLGFVSRRAALGGRAQSFPPRSTTEI